MQFEGAVVREQNQTFAIVIVKRHILNNQHEAERTARSFQPAFPGMPIVLMGQDGRGTPTYFGRSDIASFLAGVPLNSIPWRRYDLN